MKPLSEITQIGLIAEDFDNLAEFVNPYSPPESCQYTLPDACPIAKALHRMGYLTVRVNGGRIREEPQAEPINFSQAIYRYVLDAAKRLLAGETIVYLNK